MPLAIRFEYAHEKKIRERNKPWYRLAHWPIWIWVFFLAPGPLTFDLFEKGPSRRNLAWLLGVIAGTGMAALRGRLPGVEPKPYILRFTEDRPNPLYRRICYSFAWSDAVTFASLNLAGLTAAAITGKWYLRQIYRYAYFPLYAVTLTLGLTGVLPRVRPSTKGEGTERRYFYGTVWSVTLAQTLLLILWKTLPKGYAGDVIKLGAYSGSLAALGACAAAGLLPRTRPILPGELIVAD